MLMTAVLLTACDQPPSPPPGPLELSAPTESLIPFTSEVGERHRYRISSILNRSTTSRPSISNSSSPPQYLEFELDLEVRTRDGEQVEIEGRIPYITAQQQLALIQFTVDTRNANTQMDYRSEGEYQVVHPGLADKNHPLNKSWKLFKTITEQPFRIRLNTDGGFLQLQGYKPKAGDPHMLDILEPDNLALLLCLAFPPRTPQVVTADTTWTATCAEQSTIFSMSGIHGQSVTYVTQMSYSKDNSSYWMDYQGEMGGWLNTAQLQLTQTQSSELGHKGMGTIFFTSSVHSEVQIQQLQEQSETENDFSGER